MERIDVSDEMITVVGGTDVPDDLPADSIMLVVRLGELPVLTVDAPRPEPHADLRCFVTKTACWRIFGHVPEGPATYHLPLELRLIALVIRDCELPAAARRTLRLAKSIEFLCGALIALTTGALVQADPEGTLSEGDAKRIVVARRLIDERWREKLTLDTIARACGLNRAKLTRGFRATFGMTVADAIAERRLGGARTMLLATDLPVSSVGYECGYLNNASFTRAFARRYGMVPTRLRAARLAA